MLSYKFEEGGDVSEAACGNGQNAHRSLCTRAMPVLALTVLVTPSWPANLRMTRPEATSHTNTCGHPTMSAGPPALPA